MQEGMTELKMHSRAAPFEFRLPLIPGTGWKRVELDLMLQLLVDDSLTTRSVFQKAC